ncbi:hypothetical protein R4J70_13355 [Pseudomonas aeruginosa]|uniref:hypothetical protein n=1 Tax=Pseudomonas aeruginosa TaxID=287 RepID=UPI001EEECEA2|nr:hypothetical protein [Pseudomonas aeruginosa]ELQ7810532.1 hypothetical protein [Pseudomonas aeruginosa]MCG7050357.1 hypothetical protein [Pseudomonas aeruginosa]MDV7780960.1 hypothetical protein [Pseudomonas aeruginosa]HBO1522995.1 hypothetical protein [Pseudomonas aeruginosa]HCR1551490.1 hypothetical protein [Pseudomonas aeruginosa]
MEKVNIPARKTSWRKVAYIATCIAMSVFFAWQFQPKYHDNSNALSVLVTVFSILAGFLVAVMAIVGSERALKGRNWRQDTFYLLHVKQDLQKHSALFYLYLFVLALSFLASLKLGWPDIIQTGVECVLLFLACLAMLLSFSLPGQLTRRHISDLEGAIKARREREAGGARESPSDSN